MLHEYRIHLLSARKAPSTARQRVLAIERLESQVGDLLTVTTADLEAVLAAMNSRGLEAESMKAERASFRSFYQWATETNLIPSNPAANLKPISVPARVPRIAPDDAIAQSLRHANLAEQTMILLGRLECLRLAEIATLPLTAREGDWLRIRGKGDKERRIPINDDLMPVLLAQEHHVLHYGATHYFPGIAAKSGRPHMHPQSVNKIITRVTGWNPHSLRHAGATAAFRATRNLRAVQELLGHASMATTQRYLHLDDDERRAAANGTSLKLAS